MSKYDSFELDLDRSKLAFSKFYASEDSVRAADFRLRHGIKGLVITSPLHSIFHACRAKIDRILGHFSWDEVYRYTSFGPGASVDVPRRRSDAFNKYGKSKPSVTPASLDLAVAALRSNPLWSDYHRSISGEDPYKWFTIVRGNKVVTVPKSAKIDRVIAIEPMMNMYIQKGIGSVLRRRLSTAGCDLNDQTINQRLCRAGSSSGMLATIDLSSASDTISHAWIADMLPARWLEAIELTRSPYGTMPDGTELLYRKVSSMGNGFTFELESLFFLCLVRATLDYMGFSGSPHSVYGDDIVVPVSAVPLLKEVFEFVGFSFNDKKSFSSGWFRESCGKHYFSGSDVTPFYIRKKIVGVERLVWLANSIRAFSHRMVGQGYGCDRRLEGLWNDVCSMIPSKLRDKIRGPLLINDQQSDTCLGSTFDEASPVRERFGLDGYVFGSLRRRYVTKLHDSIPSMIRWFDYHRDYERPLGRVSMTQYPSESYRLVVSRQSVRRWQDCGPWLEWL